MVVVIFFFILLEGVIESNKGSGSVSVSGVFIVYTSKEQDLKRGVGERT